MPTVDDILVEVDRLAWTIEYLVPDNLKTLKNTLMEEIETIRDTVIDHDKYMKRKGNKFNQEVKPKITKSLVSTMHNDSIKCMKKHPEDKYDKSACECVHWTSHFDQDSYTLHTHTIPKVDYPSPADIKTTNALNKSNLCIINVSDRTVTCYNKNDNFSKISSQESY